MQDQEVIREFLVESHENLSRLDQELVEIEKRPRDAALLASIFRTIHTIKGTCGFFAFSALEGMTHQAENLLSQLRDGVRELTPQLVSLILETVDATRRVLASIEATGEEGPCDFGDLTERLRQAAKLPAAGIATDEPVKQEAETRTLTETAAAPAKSSAVADANIRVGVNLLDKLMDLVGELVLTRNQILQFNMEREDAGLNATSQRLNLITSELQEGVMKTRMQPIGMVWNKLPRVVRDVAHSLGKHIRLEMDGAETELDRTIIEAIKDPMVHLVRNACDHGIETPETRTAAGKPAHGRLTLRAWHEGGQVNIEIADDGAGMDGARIRHKAVEKGIIRPEQAEKLSDRESLRLIFEPGFSTAQTITNVSGRGVGMDVVKSNIEKIGGVVEVFSRPGEGSSVKLKIPLTLAIIPGLVVTADSASGSGRGECFVIPQVGLVELIRLEGPAGLAQIEDIHGTPVYRRRGSLLPIAYLNEVLGVGERSEERTVANIVVLQAEDRQYGLVVDGISDTQEIVVKPLGKQLKALSIYAGATVMGDGRVALILDVLGIGNRSGVLSDTREQGRTAPEKVSAADEERQRLLLFRAGSFDRLAIPLSLVARLEEFPRSLIERAGGSEVIQYRGRILPLISLRQVLEPGAPPAPISNDPVQAIVFTDKDRSLGVVVDQIIDIAEEAVSVRQVTGRAGLLGSAVVGRSIADFLDLDYVLQHAASDWLRSAGGASGATRILLADGSAFSRGLIRGSLDMAGYRVLEAATFADALRGMEQHSPDVVVAALDLPPDGSPALIDAIRRRPEWERIPILAVGESEGEGVAGVQGYQSRADRAGMLESIARLAAAVNGTEAGALTGQEK